MKNKTVLTIVLIINENKTENPPYIPPQAGSPFSINVSNKLHLCIDTVATVQQKKKNNNNNNEYTNIYIHIQ